MEPRDRLGLLVSLLSFGMLSVLAFTLPAVRGGDTDFRNIYTGAKLAGTAYLYSVPHIVATQAEVSASGQIVAFLRPPVYAAMLSPFGRLPYRSAHIVWQAVNLTALAGFLALWRATPLEVMLCCWFVPMWVSFGLYAQDVPLFLLAIAAFIALHRRGHGLLAGLALAFVGIKFHLFVLLPVLIAARRLWRCAAGFVVGIAALIAGCYLAGGPDWMQRYYDLVRVNEQAQDSQAIMANLYGLVYAAPYPLLWVVLAGIAAAGGTWFVARRYPLKESLALALAGGLLISLHAFAYDCVLLLPLVLVLARRATPQAALAASVGLGATVLLLLPFGTRPLLPFLGQLGLVTFCLIAFSKLRASLGRGHIAEAGGLAA